VTLRATLTIVAFSCAVGILFAAISIPVMEQRERKRIETRVGELAATVASTVSIACYVNDATLAREVASGLLTNSSVSGVVIRAGETILVNLPRTTSPGEPQEHVAAVVRSVYSPFDAAEKVGELTIVPDASEILSEARAYARYLGFILALQAAALAAVVAQVVLRSIVRPIKHISDDLHRLQVEQGEQLAPPHGNERNEIGRLASDVNALIDRLVRLLSSEREQRRERERNERQFRLIFDNAEFGIFVIDDSGVLLSWNHAFSRELGLPAERPTTSAEPRLEQLLEAHAARVRELIAEVGSTGKPTSIDIQVGSARGGARWLNVLLQPVEEHRLQGMLTDVTSHKRATVEALELAEHDPLTGLTNRRGMEHELVPLLAEVSAGRRQALAVMMLDLDKFKQVNDVHGHEAGDFVLRTVASRLQRGVRPGDTIARVGGDEFVLVLTDIVDPVVATELAGRLIASISEPMALPNGPLVQVGASIGIALAGKHYDSLEEIVKAADEAMYAAKQAGRSRCRVASVDSLAAAS
jgi:diguanylate cyclase (GGDEF)-like protein/PAS domain S-box-containing protein